MKKVIQLLNSKPWIFWVYCFLLLLPSMLFSTKGFTRALYPILILIALINKWRPFLWATFIIGLGVPAALFLQWTFKSPMNESFWLILSGSNINEATAYLKGNAILVLVFVLMAFAFWLYSYKSTPNFTLIENKKLRIFFLVFLVIPIIHAFKRPHDMMAEFNHHFTESYPLNFVFSYGSAMADLREMDADGVFVDIDSLKIVDPGKLESTVVLVLGESARRDRHQLFGSTVANNPKLTELKNELNIFNNVVTLHPHTVASVPVILTKQSGVQESLKSHYSLMQIFKAAGYQTYWISNQASLGDKGSLVGKYGRSADFSHFFHIHSANLPYSYDQEVLDLFKEKLKEPSSKKLFVLHLQGSHYGFKNRYPSEFAKFEDPYDNTLLYTDYILAETIHALKDSRKPSMLMYVSDHGLLLDECGKKFSHFDNKESFEIPFFMWLSPNFAKENYKAKFATQENDPYTTRYVVDTLAGLNKIKYSGADETLDLSSESVSANPARLVKTYSEVVNYDKAANDSACHLKETK